MGNIERAVGVVRAMRLSVPLAFVPAILTAGCALLVELDDPTPAVVAELEVFNRTEEDVFYLAADGERLDVPACGSASDPTFRIDAVRVRTERGFGAAAPELAGRSVHVIEVARAQDSGTPTAGLAPDPLPPCEGRTESQPGG